MKKMFKNQKGSVLIISLIITSVVFSVGATILNISEKDKIRTSISYKSSNAVRVLDTVFECVLYHDFQNDLFNPRKIRIEKNLECGDNLIGFSGLYNDQSELPFSACDTSTDTKISMCDFLVREDSETYNNKPCALVHLEKSCSDGSDISSCDANLKTKIDIISYDLCDFVNTNVVHRRINTSY